MHGVFLHILADTLGSVVVIISAIVIWVTEEPRKLNPNKYKLVDYVDPTLSVIMVVLITCSAWPLRGC
jgi:zinc transporter 1